MVGTGDAGGAPPLQTQAQQHGIVLFPQPLHGHLAAHPGVVADLHPHGLDDADVRVQPIVGHTVGGDAVARHTAALLQGLVDHHLMAVAGQIEGRGEARRPRPHDAHGATAGRLLRETLGDDGTHPLVAYGVHGEALQPADGHGLAALADGAGGLATVGAYPPAGVGEGVGAVDLVHRLLQVLLPDGTDVLRGVHVGRAGVVAHAALYAARGLDDGLLEVVAFDDLLEVVHPLGGGALGHGLAVGIHEVVLGGLGPALAVVLVMDPLGVRQDEVAGQLLVGTGVDVLPGQADGARGAQIHAQGAPAAAAVVDGRTQVAHPVQGVLRQARHPHHGNGRVVAHLLAGGAADARLPVVDVKAAVAHGGHAGAQRFGYGLAGEELEGAERVED